MFLLNKVWIIPNYFDATNWYECIILLLGYALVQIPDFIFKLYVDAKRRFYNSKNQGKTKIIPKNIKIQNPIHGDYLTETTIECK